MNSRWIALLSLLSLLPPSHLVSQEAISPGARIRVSAPELSSTPITGTVASIDTAAIILADADGRTGQVIRFESVGKVEVARGSRSHAGNGVKIGAGIGGGLGLPIHSTRWKEVSLPRVSLMPRAGGFALALTRHL